MAAVVTGSKTVTTNVSPNFTAASLTTLLAIAVENLTTQQLATLQHAVDKLPFGGETTTKTLGALFI